MKWILIFMILGTSGCALNNSAPKPVHIEGPVIHDDVPTIPPNVAECRRYDAVRNDRLIKMMLPNVPAVGAAMARADNDCQWGAPAPRIEADIQELRAAASSGRVKPPSPFPLRYTAP